MGKRGPKTQSLDFGEWWPIVMQLWRRSGRTTSISESELRILYDRRLSPLKANDELVKEDRKKIGVEGVK